MRPPTTPTSKATTTCSGGWASRSAADLTWSKSPSGPRRLVYQHDLPARRPALEPMAQMLGGVLAARIRGLFHHRVSALIAMAGGSAITIAAIGLADTTGLPQRHDPVTAASHDPLVRLADELRRPGLEPAGARPGRRRLGLRAVLRDVRRHRGARPSVPRPVAAADLLGEHLGRHKAHTTPPRHVVAGGGRLPDLSALVRRRLGRRRRGPRRAARTPRPSAVAGRRRRVAVADLPLADGRLRLRRRRLLRRRPAV